MATTIVYLGLSYNVFDVGEKVSDFFAKDYLSEDMDSEFHEASLRDWINSQNQDKPVASNTQSNSNDTIVDTYQNLFDNLCEKNYLICNKVDFDWEYKSKDKYDYFEDSVYILWWINWYLRLGENFLKSFNYLNLYQKSDKKRGYTRSNDVYINTLSIKFDDEFKQLLGHEFGHILDLFTIKWYNKKKDSSFTEFEEVIFPIDDPSIEYYKLSWEWEKIRKSDAKPEDFCSGYGMFDPFEDFAECHNLYLNHNYIFRFFAISNSIMKKKYNYMANLYAGKYLDKNIGYFDQKNRNTNYRYWDTTRISY